MVNFPEQIELTKDDYVIVSGGFGGVWMRDEECEKEKGCGAKVMIYQSVF